MHSENGTSSTYEGNEKFIQHFIRVPEWNMGLKRDLDVNGWMILKWKLDVTV
jgi:hypothetical protein